MGSGGEKRARIEAAKQRGLERAAKAELQPEIDLIEAENKKEQDALAEEVRKAQNAQTLSAQRSKRLSSSRQAMFNTPLSPSAEPTVNPNRKSLMGF